MSFLSNEIKNVFNHQKVNIIVIVDEWNHKCFQSPESKYYCHYCHFWDVEIQNVCNHQTANIIVIIVIFEMQRFKIFAITRQQIFLSFLTRRDSTYQGYINKVAALVTQKYANICWWPPYSKFFLPAGPLYIPLILESLVTRKFSKIYLWPP